MTYTQAIEYIHSLLRFGISPGLERITALLDCLGNPQNSLDFVHVAGTNGKGTTCTEISEITKAAGLKTGLFTSPYVIDFCERIQVNNRYISHSDLAGLVTEVKAAMDKIAGEGIQPTEFETITAIALLYFKRQNCDLVVLECGMGGGHDSTNVIPAPLVSVFTSISLDHMAVLGNTVSEIAEEKSGIIKKGSLAVCYPRSEGGLGFAPQNESAVAELELAAERAGCPLYFASADSVKILSESIEGSLIQVGDLRVQVPFMGRHQVANALTAIEAAKHLRELGFPITDVNITEGISRSRIPARMEKLTDRPLVILDGGHNEGCARAVSEAVKKYLPGRRIVALIGFMADKDCETALSMLLPLCESAVFTTPKNPRSCPAGELLKLAKTYCSDLYAVEDSSEALEKARSLTGDEDVLLICGSFYLAGEIRDKW